MISRMLFTPLILLFVMASCITTNEEIDVNTFSESFSFPETFGFKTSKTLSISTKSEMQGVVDVYLIDENSTHVGKFGSQNHEQNFVIPSTTETIRLVYQDGSNEKTAVFNVNNIDNISWDISSDNSSANGRTSNSEVCRDRLYAVENAAGGFWDIDLSTGNYEEIDLPTLTGGGSIACALDQENSYVYYNVGKTMYRYDLIAEAFETVFTSNPYGKQYPRLTYKDGFFYMSNGNTMYKVDASNNQVVAQYKISGFVNSTSGGDLDFASDGSLYLACFSGLYKFTSMDDAAGKATVERISAENFPYQLTSMAIDREDNIFVGTNDARSNLINISIEDGSYEIVKTFDHKINDLAAWKCADEDLADVDSDGDGVKDALDDYPNDANAAYDVYTPSEIGFGTLAFEDMWPLNGDYDFNDMVINYRFVNVLNTDNESIRLQIHLKLLAAGATFKNGFGIELPVDKSVISSVEGARLTENIINTDNKGLESGQSNAVIIPFDNALKLFNAGSIVNTRSDEGIVSPVDVTITVSFTQPIPAAIMDNPPYNPFIFVKGNRGQEIHLKNEMPTDLADISLFQTGEDYSELQLGKSYQNADNVPWAINLIHNFRFPEEKTRIDKAYNFFTHWGQSGGSSYPDWYKDNAGYREDNKLIFIDK